MSGAEAVLGCCSDCGDFALIPEEHHARAIKLIELLDRDREAGLFETDETVEEWLRRRLEELEGRE